VSRLEGQKSELERTMRNYEAVQQKASALTTLLAQRWTIALDQELQVIQQDPLYRMSLASYKTEMQSVDRSLQTTLAALKPLATAPLVFDVVWSSVFYTNRFVLTFESTVAHVRTPDVAMCLSLYDDVKCLGTYTVNDACTKYEFVCTTPFLAKQVRIQCSNVQAANWRIVAVLPQVLSGSYELERPVCLWGATRSDARCTLLQTSPVELEIPIDMCPVSANQAVNTFPIVCPHKPGVNSYLWFLDASASWMLVPYKRNRSHADDQSSSVLQIGIYLT
jgi:hypothetical protein